jgi:hypothetical protein
MSPSLILPRRLADELNEQRRRYRQAVLDSIVLDDSDPLLLDYCRRLQAFDPRLMLVRARGNVAPGVPMKPGYYHLLIDNGPEVPLSVTVIEGANGEFCEPTSRLFEKLVAGDMTQRRNLERMARIERAEYEANEREKQRNRAERREHLRDLVNAYTRTSISMNTARPWTQNNQPNAQRDAGERRYAREINKPRGPVEL